MEPQITHELVEEIAACAVVQVRAGAGNTSYSEHFAALDSQKLETLDM